MYSKAAVRDIIDSGGQHFRETSNSYIFYCPLCSKEKLYIRKSDGHFNCWVCAGTEGFRGDVEFALKALYGGTIEEWRRLVRGDTVTALKRIDVMLIDHWDREDGEIEVDPPLEAMEWPMMSLDHRDPAFEPGRRYLNGRGITDAIIEKYDIHYNPWDNRVQFPFVVGGKLVGWQGRTLGPTEITDAISGRVRQIPKALTTLQEGIQGKHFMFGDNVQGSPHVVLCEGPVDALKADLCGGNVANLGKGVNLFQLERLAKRVDSIYFALDPDAAADTARLIKSAKLTTTIYILEPPAGCKDLGEAEPEAVLENFKTARPFYAGQIMVQVGERLCY